MKKLVALTLAFLLLSGLTACTKSNTNSTGGSTAAGDKVTDTSPEHTHNFADATCTQPKTCDCGATEGAALGHNYENGVCTRCSEKDPAHVTPFTEKKGNWRLNIISGNQISVVKVSVSGSDGDLLCLRGAPFDTYDKSLTDQRPDDSETVNGITYWYEVGDGCYLEFSVNDNSVTFTSDEFDMSFTLTRVDENSMKVTSVQNIPPRFYELEKDCLFTFEAE